MPVDLEEVAMIEELNKASSEYTRINTTRVT